MNREPNIMVQELPGRHEECRKLYKVSLIPLLGFEYSL